MKKIWVIAAMAMVHASGQSPELAVITRAADALGGKTRIEALRTIVIEGSGTNPNVG